MSSALPNSVSTTYPLSHNDVVVPSFSPSSTHLLAVSSTPGAPSVLNVFLLSSRYYTITKSALGVLILTRPLVSASTSS